MIAALTTYLSLSKDTAKAQKDLAEQGPKVTIEMEKQVKAWEKSAAAVKKFNEAERDLLEVQRDLLKSRLAPKEEELKRQLENLERLREKEQELLETIRNANEERAKIAQLVADAEKTVAEALGPGAERDPVKRIRALRKEAREFGVIQNRADLERANALLSKVVSFRRTLGEDSSQLFPSRKLIKDILGDIREAGFRLEQQQARQVKTGEKELNRIRDAIQTAEQSIKPLRATVEFIRKTLSEIEAIIRFEDEAALRAKARKIHRDMMKEFPPIIQRVQVQRLGGGRLDLTPQFGGANPPGGGPGSGGFDATVPGTRFTPVPGPAFDLSPKVPAFQA
ncbi:MAG: hypothetical protein GWN88_10575, partial [Nitrospinaceae bacterium]|nr:hypothetical protein [Nitrospinaceae bacterium]NIU96721.1 hypothetical protein [Nitrospinaceae bacterium]